MGQQMRNVSEITDAKLVDAARTARLEVGTFEDMHQSVREINGVIELLYQATRHMEPGNEGVNWCAVHDALARARGLCGPLYGATSLLAQSEL